MRYLSLASVSLFVIMSVVGLVAPPAVAGQGAQTDANSFQTPWGHPDLQGIWANDTSTPLERPSAFAGQEVLTDEERAACTSQQQKQSFGANADRRDAAPGTVTDVGRAYNSFWFPVAGEAIARTSLIVDPPDGRVPPQTPQARERYVAWAEAKGLFNSAANPEGSLWNGGRTDSAPEDGTEGGVDGRGSRADHPEDRRLSERCIIWTPLPRLPGGYNKSFPDCAESRTRGHRTGDDARRAHHPAGRRTASSDNDTPVARRPTWSLGGRHAGRRHDQFHGQGAVQGIL